MATLLRSPRSAAMEKRRLVDPTEQLSWSVDVVSVVPKQIVNKRETAIAGATLGKWACCGFPDGYFYVWQMKTSNLNEPLEASNQAVKFYLPNFAMVDNNGEQIDTAAPLMALSPSQGDSESVQLYILHTLSGEMTMIKVPHRDVSSPSLSASTTTRSPTKVTAHIAEDYDLQDGETFDTLTCEGQLVVVGTSRGTLLLIKYVSIPSGLHPQKIEANKSGILDRFFGKRSPTEDQSNGDQTPHVLPLSDTNFLSVSTSAGIVQWNVEEKLSGGHFAIFHPLVRLDSFAKALASESWQLTKILQATLTADHEAFHAIVQGKAEGETRLFWVVFDVNGAMIQAHWLSRFAMPDQVEVLGLVACENGTAYAAFTLNETVVLMILVNDGNFIQELDLPPRHAPGLFPGMMKRDMATHGCFLIATTGIALRTRYLATESQLTKRPRLKESEGKISSLSSIQTLVSHLRSHFWQVYQNQGVDRPLPPSLRQNDPNMEQAVINFAVELQQKGVASSYKVALDWHHGYIKTIQDCGIYRCLSTRAKWNLFAIGQELHAFGAIAETLLRKYKHHDLGWVETLSPHDLGQWLLSIQESQEESGWSNSVIWNDILESSLSALWIFQEDMAGPMYDITSDYGPIGWISKASMQTMLHRQICTWKKNPATAPHSTVELVVKTAFRSFYGSWKETGSESSKEEFASIQVRSIPLLRSSSEGMDEKAFELCIQYQFFNGICEISLAHERKADNQFFSLDPLFEKIQGRDLLNDMTFPEFVLQWHADKKLYGHVLNYGVKCISDLNLILDRNDELRQYKWISCIRQKYYEQATQSFLENAEVTKGIENIEWNLNFAKLSNKLVHSQNQSVLHRQGEIERRLEIVEAQKILCECMDNDTLLPPVKLIEVAIEKLNEARSIEEQVEIAVVALTLCTTLTDQAAIWENKVKVWTEILLLNGALWSEWARGGFGNDLEYVRGEILDNTVFGSILKECRKDSNMARVAYGRDMETEVIDRVYGDENRESFTRLLRAVAAPTQTGTGESLMVSAF
ncbi:hypothetical protein IV203_031640 [Nitzschia inconspicua]|uniref:Uncharacterized protein n=1 Tax=Nitzschia inconspicua TaxID=303405 RepID=A0A9K3LVA2_9STRA|nr:hypothetical protein IV203_031640 [Nitzschia inconspicua]